jgi:Xaa-Pro dipeptidase
MSDPVSKAEARVAEVQRRLDATRTILRAHGANGAVFRTRRNFAWLTAGGQNHVLLSTEVGVAALHMTMNDAWIETPINEAARIRDEEVRGLPIEVQSIPWYEERALGRVPWPVAAGTLTDWDLEPDLWLVRSRLSPFDHQHLAWLGQRTIEALEQALGAVHAGQSEDELAADAIRILAEVGIRAPVVLVAADERIERYRHPLPGATAIQGRVMLVLVAERGGLHVAATRFRELEPASDERRRRVAATSDVERAMHEATVPGATLGDVFDAARRAYAAAGFADELGLHHQGGLIGYQGRERIAAGGDTTRIEPGMAFAWNPSITGAKAENTFILEEDGTRRILTKSS